MSGRSYGAANIEEIGQGARFADRPAQPACSSRSIASAARMICVVLREAFAAQRRYEHLRQKKLPDDVAIRRAFFGPE